MRNLEIGDADRAHQPRIAQAEQALEGLHIAVLGRVGPVDQQQVHIVQPEALEARLTGRARTVDAVPFLVELGGDEQFLARHTGVADALTHADLVAVVLGGVDMAISDAQRAGHSHAGLVVIHGPGSQPYLRNARPSGDWQCGGSPWRRW